MRKVLIIIIAAVIMLTSCRVMKKLKVVQVPKAKLQQKSIENDAAGAYDEGRYTDSILALKALIKKNPKNPKYWSQLGSAYAQLNQFGYAEYAYKKAIKHNPKNVKAMYNLSLVYSEKGAQHHALKTIQHALKIDPKNPLLQASLGNVLIDKEKYDKAKKIYTRIVDVKPDFDIGHFNLGVINYHERNLDEAEKNYKDVLKINSQDVDAKQNLAAIQILKHNYEDAIKNLKEVLNSNVVNDITLENAYYNLGVAYLRIKEYKKALNSFEMAIKIEPWDMAAYVNAAILSEELGLKKKAIKYWQKYDRLLPVNKRKQEIAERLKKLGVNYKPVETPTPVKKKKKKKKKIFDWNPLKKKKGKDKK